MRERNCNKSCGECCKVVLLSNYTKTQWRENKWPWPIKHLVQIRKKDAIKLRPLLKHKSWKKTKYYRCDFFDYKKKICKDYENRPHMCYAFPYYSDVAIDVNRLVGLKDCYYQHQIMKVG